MMQAVLLLGTNLNDRMQNLSLARKNIIERIGMIETESATYRTAPWGNTEQNDFLNKVVKLPHVRRLILWHAYEIMPIEGCSLCDRCGAGEGRPALYLIG